MTTKAKTTGSSKQRRKTARLEGAARTAVEQPAGSRRKRVALRVLKWGAILGIVGMALGATSLASIFWYYGRDPNLPNIQSLSDYDPLQVTRIAARDGAVVGEIFTERRTFVAYDDIPELVVQAFISAEDANFFEHGGLDYWGMLRAFIVNVRSGKKKQGASTITQQVVKTFLLSPERTLRRKVQEIILARRLEQALKKDEILSLYLNQIYFGHGRYGVQEASRFYFGKDVGQLNAGEAAMLAGLPQSPERISPKKGKNQPRSKRRQKYVLEQMAHHDYISRTEAQQWINDPIRIIREPFPDNGSAPEWVEVARQELISRFGEDKLDKLGARVVTTFDASIQKAATDALREGLRAVDKRQRYGRTVRKVKPDKLELEVKKLARKLPSKGPKHGGVYSAVVRSIDDEKNEVVVDLGDWRASIILGDKRDERYNPRDAKTGKQKRPSERFAVGHVVKVQRSTAKGKKAPVPVHSEHLVELAPGPQGAVVVIDPKTRHVLALVGGYKSRIGDFNRATQARRQPGSSFKPIVYTAALDSGSYTAATIVNDAPEVYDLWKPQNYKKGSFAGPIRLRHALAKSINTVAIRLLHDVGVDRVRELARDMGIGSDLPESLSLALGSGEVTPLEMTNAIATLAAGGVASPPVFVREIDGKPVPPPATREVLSKEISFIALNMMTSVVKEGTARRARKLKMPVAGKTGTSNEARDTWFLGVTPSYVVGVWVGFDDNRPVGRKETGGKTALPVFVSLMETIGKNERRKSFAMPGSIERIRIDKPTGLRAPEDAARDTIFTEYFVQGTAPTETALAANEVSAETLVESEYEDEYGDESPGGDGDSGSSDTMDDDYEESPATSGTRPPRVHKKSP